MQNSIRKKKPQKYQVPCYTGKEVYDSNKIETPTNAVKVSFSIG